MEVRFLSSNKYKVKEVSSILDQIDVRVLPIGDKIEEIQTDDVYRLVRDKTLKAFGKIGRPIFVEHTGLHLPGLSSLPGGLTQVFWDALQADSFVSLVGGLSSRKVVAKTVIGYCDAQQIHYFDGEVSGTVSIEPLGSRDFQWDCVFVPDGYSKTFAELGEDKKNEISMRRIALDKFSKFLKGAM